MVKAPKLVNWFILGDSGNAWNVPGSTLVPVKCNWGHLWTTPGSTVSCSHVALFLSVSYCANSLQCSATQHHVGGKSLVWKCLWPAIKSMFMADWACSVPVAAGCYLCWCGHPRDAHAMGWICLANQTAVFMQSCDTACGHVTFLDPWEMTPDPSLQVLGARCHMSLSSPATAATTSSTASPSYYGGV